MILEVAAFNVDDAVKAEKAGADRIELCHNYTVGGITCSNEVLKEARAKVNTQLFAIIRPKPGLFVYSQQDFFAMKNSILLCKQLSYNGIVLGILNSNNTVNVAKTAMLVELAYPLSVTFHKAFDLLIDIEQGLEDVIKTGCNRILTSGGKKTALEGAQTIYQLIKKGNKNITIIPGGGIRSNHIIELASITKATEFHSAAITSSSNNLDSFEVRLLKEKINSFG